MKNIEIGGRVIGNEQPCFIVAEVGVNHNGDPDIAKHMVDVIADAGADCVKFQTFSADEFVNSPDEMYEYYSQGKKIKESMLKMFKRLELKREEFKGLFEHARKRNIIPLSTPTDKQAVDLLNDIGARAFKVGSDDLVYKPFLEYMAKKKKPIIISTGMANVADIDRAVNTIIDAGNDQIIILHCISLYPTPDNEVNLRKISTLRSMYDFPIGFSDHSYGITAALGAVVLGACVLEKHFTLDRNMPGPDHWFSSDPEELKNLVKEVRRLELSMGKGRMWPSKAELEMAKLCRRSIVTGKNLLKGYVIQEEDLAYRRPGTGILPYDLNKILGRRTRFDLPAGTILEQYQLEKIDE